MSNAFISEEDLLFAQAQERSRERRERIATAALNGLLAGAHANMDLLVQLHKQTEHIEEKVWVGFAKDALRAADALIAELDKQP